MRVVIAGAGSVGRSIARELLGHGHQVTLVDKEPAAMRVSSVSQAEWLLADACEISTLDQARLDSCDVVVAATGDDKANLVLSLLAKTEYAVPRTVARVNNPKNEWMFDDAWGVDVPVSTPRIMTALVEEAVSVGDLVRIFTFHQSGASMYEFTLAPDAPVVGQRYASIAWPGHSVLAAIIRGELPIAPSPDDTLEAGDELLLISASEDPQDLAQLQELLGGSPSPTSPTAPRPTSATP